MKKYEQIRKKLKTGDIVLFSGKGAVSGMIKWFTRSKWSHVGMVLNNVIWDMVLLWESTTLSKIKDVESNEARQGVQLVPLSERVQTYDGDIAIRHLEGVNITDDMINNLMAFRHEVKGRPYEKSKIELIKSAYDWVGGANQEDLSSIFCSELVAEAYQRMGLLPEEIPSNEYTPKDFAGLMELEQGKLGKLIYI